MKGIKTVFIDKNEYEYEDMSVQLALFVVFQL